MTDCRILGQRLILPEQKRALKILPASIQTFFQIFYKKNMFDIHWHKHNFMFNVLSASVAPNGLTEFSIRLWRDFQYGPISESCRDCPQISTILYHFVQITHQKKWRYLLFTVKEITCSHRKCSKLFVKTTFNEMHSFL